MTLFNRLLIVVAVCATQSAARAETRIDVGLALTLPFFKGAGAEVGFVPAGSKLRLVAGAFTLAPPSAFLGDNPGWSRRDAGGSLGVEYFLVNHLFVGAEFQAQNLRYSKAGASIDVIETDVNAKVGFHWNPLHGHALYITPGVLVIIPFYRNHEPTLGGETFKESLPVRIVPLLVAGWEF